MMYRAHKNIIRASYTGITITFSSKVALLYSCLVYFTSVASAAQKLKDFYIPRLAQVSIVAGMGTNGISSGQYANYFSLNILTGYSGGNNFFELGGISNFVEGNVNGLQIAGIGNLIGGNAFNKFTPKDKLKWIKDGLTSNVSGIQIAGIANIIGGDELPRYSHQSDATGLQISGLINKVSGNVTGLQLTGGVNFVDKDLLGVGIAGISNQCIDQLFGFQFAGIRNSATKGIDGGQISLLVNSTRETLIGYQISSFNFAGKIKGRSLFSKSETDFGVQVGLFNKSKVMNGYQFGLLNAAKEMNGFQFGLINIYKSGSGIPVGLLNIGFGGHTRFYASDLFLYNIEKATGNCTNCGVFPRKNNKRLIHTIHFGYNPDFFFSGRPKWSIGYGIGQSVYNVALFPYNEEWFYEYDIQILHLNADEKFKLPINAMFRLRLSAGHRINVKMQSVYLFGGISINYNRSVEIESFSKNTRLWPGVHAGLHFH